MNHSKSKNEIQECKALYVMICNDYFQLEEKNSPYTDDNGDFKLRVQIISLQTVPVAMRAIPRFEFQAKHLLRAR